MFSSYLLSLREGIEVALLIGITLGTLRKFERPQLVPVVWSGIISAVVISLLTAIILNRIGVSVDGDAEKIFEGITMLVAAGVLTWMIFWMRCHARNLRVGLETDIRRAVLHSGKKALFIVAFVVVLREGIELALFLTSVTMTSTVQQTLLGSVLGLSTAFILGWILFTTTIKLDLRRFFDLTGILLILFAAGLVAHGIHEFNEVGWVPPIIEPVWDINFILDEQSILGSMLKALFGYNGNPSLSEVLAYLTYFAAIVFGLRWNFFARSLPQEP